MLSQYTKDRGLMYVWLYMEGGTESFFIILTPLKPKGDTPYDTYMNI